MPFKPESREYRSIKFDGGTVDSGETNGDTLKVCGMPIVFNTPTLLYDYGDEKYYEQIDTHALDGCDFSDFIFNRNHGENESTVYARSRNGSLKHTITDRGLEVEITLDANDQRHVWLYNDIKAGRVDKMSFSFSCNYEYEYNSETHTRTITKIRKLYDVSAVDFPAYDAATISARSFFDAEHAKEKGRKEFEARKKRMLIKTYL